MFTDASVISLWRRGVGGKLRVLFLVRKLTGGGAERVTALLCNYFAERGIDVYVYEIDGCSCDYVIGSNVHRMHCHHSSLRILGIVQKIIGINAVCIRVQPDYIVSLGLLQYVRCIKIRPKKGLILSERNYPDALYTARRKKINESQFLRAKSVVFQTSDARDCYCEEVRKKGVVIPNPIPTGLPIHDGDREKRAVTFSRLEPQKNLALLIESFSKFHKYHPGWTLEIYGQGSQKDFLDEKIHELGLSGHATIKPFSNDIHRLISKAGMFISSSDYEGLQNSLIEAMVMGIPCVATDCLGGGARMITDGGRRGLLVQRGDTAGLADAMSSIADSDILAQQLSEAGKRLSQEWSAERILSKWVDLVK